MKVIVSLFFVAALLACIHTVVANVEACGTAPASDLCRIEFGQVAYATQCSNANKAYDPSIAVVNSTFSGYDPTCTRALRKDGSSCWKALASLQCSLQCTPCGQSNTVRPCFKLCDKIYKKCSTAAKLGYCLPKATVCAAEEVDTCDSIKIKSSKLVKPSKGL